MKHNTNDIEVELQNIKDKLSQSLNKHSLELEFTKKANLLYEKNLIAFKKYLPEIYEKFVNFLPKGEFELFIEDNGDANIVDYATKVPMYSKTPAKQVNSQVSNALESPIFSKISYDYLEKMENKYDFLHVELLKKAGKVYSKAQKELTENRVIDGKVPSVVIFGIGLGYHLENILKNVPSTYINLFEPEEDYFYASLFTFDWSNYLECINEAGSFLYISIGVSEDEIYQNLHSRAQDQGPFTISNSWFFQHYPSQSIDNIIYKLRDNFHEFFMGWGFIDDAFMSLAHSCENVNRRIPFCHAHSSIVNNYKHFPVLVVANGPSLDSELDLLKSIREKVIIVSCNSASTALINNGIIPDFHAALERSRATYDFLKAFLPESARKQMALLTVNVMHQDVAELFSWVGAGLKGREAGTSLHQVSEILEGKTASATLPFCNPLVGNMALSHVVTLGFKNIYLFGVDNGYVDPSHHHSKSSMYYNREGDTVYQPLQIGSKMLISGNFGQDVIADHFLYSGKVQMERLLKTERAKGVYCYNCSGGAKIEGTLSLRSSDLIIENQNVSKHDVVEYVKNSLFYIPDEDFKIEKHLDFEGFEKLCDTLIDILSEPVNSRTEAYEQVIKQVHLLTSLKETQFSHHYMVLEGEALYLSSIIINMLFNYGSSQSILPYYQELKAVWCDFLASAPDLYRENWNKSSDHIFEV
ncbi:6-hydroxymethylpterin diphosphokinase MptE-like protein [Pseudoalteromonas sp. M8]|uniref:motility associated factor glycosyltransferase family protein n=1 Tax=Pseudoalteromonas sp. M8 TaxID=2692624 RepID=UPI001BABDF5B|nr:6-hydroxymethylpterin diphosphokinase MptE-like protein [Pseudoalteromonas sp. M8]QUI70387.1 DUF115 domain-containing protein [Pseudoalteromonas sp. M8]